MYLQTYSIYPEDIDNKTISEAINKLACEYFYDDSDRLGYLIFNNQHSYQEFCIIINKERGKYNGLR